MYYMNFKLLCINLETVRKYILNNSALSIFKASTMFRGDNLERQKAMLYCSNPCHREY